MAIINGNEDNNSGLTGTQQVDTINGLGGNDVLQGFGGNDTLNGGGDDDILFGGVGNDTLDGGAGFDFAAYYDGGNRGITADLGAARVTDQYGNVDTLIGIEGITGTDRDDSITGSGRADKLAGRSGNDTLFGGDGTDEIKGGAGDDVIQGGFGRDTLSGGPGADTFVYKFNADSFEAQFDIITDFQTGVDRIDVHAIDANLGVAGDQDFDLISGQSFSAPGQVVVLNGAGGTRLQFNVDGDVQQEFEILLSQTPLNLTDANFIF